MSEQRTDPTMTFSCPHCAKVYHFPSRIAGRRTRCIECSGDFRVPQAMAQEVKTGRRIAPKWSPQITGLDRPALIGRRVTKSSKRVGGEVGNAVKDGLKDVAFTTLDSTIFVAALILVALALLAALIVGAVMLWNWVF